MPSSKQRSPNQKKISWGTLPGKLKRDIFVVLVILLVVTCRSLRLPTVSIHFKNTTAPRHSILSRISRFQTHSTHFYPFPFEIHFKNTTAPPPLPPTRYCWEFWDFLSSVDLRFSTFRKAFVEVLLPLNMGFHSRRAFIKDKAFFSSWALGEIKCALPWAISVCKLSPVSPKRPSNG